MKKLFAASLVLASCSLQAAPINDLLELNNSEQQMQIIRTNLNKALIRQNPPLSKFEPVLNQWAETYLTWDEMKPKIAEVYLKHFTDEELEQLVAFYKTPVGQKSQALNATLIRETALASAMVAKGHHKKLEEMLQQAAAQVKQQQEAAN
ncbi:DUF2059 domain-containing protein [Agarivorans sp. Toyoura001]|uniref:DUF2059 domain-containing protein n=1 Tax=unclassified Agarivorans TaxID=2636026 RepID=UPI0010E19C02|nr:DUF2059 domain-containing protein [Agarivorans sp. Toyoura001]GDY26887.1 hypothetical protein AHAT_27770 [Agarivorans sp. Toyoura001]